MLNEISETQRSMLEAAAARQDRQLELPALAVEIARQARYVARAPSARPVRPRDRRRDLFDPLREGRIVLIGEAVIVLDAIDAAKRETARQLAKLPGRHALRLERRASERASARPHPVAQFGKTLPRAAKAGEDLSRQDGVAQHHILEQRSVAK